MPVGDVCQDSFHALLALEWEVPGGPGGISHFYAVSAYELQHPDSMRLTVEATAGLRSAVSDALAGATGVEQLRTRARHGAAAAGRVTRREGDAVPSWPVDRWTTCVTDILEGGVEGYAQRVEHWARSVVADIEAGEGA